MTPRTVLIAIDVPAAVTDLALARRIQTVLRQACIASDNPAGDLLWPDPTSIEVTVYSLSKEAFLSTIGEPS